MLGYRLLEEYPTSIAIHRARALHCAAMAKMHCYLTAVLLSLSGAVWADTCLVVSISDGDTLKARCGSAGAYEQVIVRINEIDAPEKGQPFGHASKQTLGALCYMALADIHAVTQDRYRRTVANVQCRGRDAAMHQVSIGMAWAYTKYLKDPELSVAEAGARGQQRGLWADLKPVPPWEWRKERRGSARRDSSR